MVLQWPVRRLGNQLVDNLTSWRRLEESACPIFAMQDML